MADDPNAIISALESDPGAADKSPNADPEADATIHALNSDTAPAEHPAVPDAPKPKPRAAQKPIPRMAAKANPGAPRMAASAPVSAPELSLGDALKQGAQNFLPSFKGQVVGAVEPLLPQNWGKDVKTAVQLAKGVGAKTGLIDSDDATKKAADEQLVNAIGGYYKNKYGSMEGFKENLAHDPASFLTDASAALSIPAGGEGLLAKLPGALGEAGETAARVAGAASRATNPVGITGRAAAAILPKTNAVNALGKLNGGVKRTIDKAFNGRLDSADIASDPAALQALQSTVQQKGATPAAAKEALLRRFAPDPDASIPRQSVTGQAAPYGAAGMVRDAIGTMKGRIAQTATEMTGATAPHESALGDALEQSQIAAHNQYVDNYNAVGAHQGEFDPSFAASLPTEIESSLKASNLPSTAADMMKHPEYVRGEAVNAINWLHGHVADLAANNNLTPQALMDTRKSLGYLWTQSKGSDSKAISAMTDALDSHIEGAARNGLYNGGNGVQVADDMKNAIASYRQYKQNYANTSNPTHGTVASAMKNLMPDQARDPSTGMITSPAAPGSTSAAQGQIASKLINPRTLAVPPQAEKLFGKLVDVTGGPGSPGEQAARDFVRQSVTKTATDAHGNTTLAANPDQIQAFVQTPLASKVFSSQELSTLKQAAEAQRLLLHSPSKMAKVESLIGALTGRGVRTMSAAAVGHVAGGPIGGFLAGSLENVAENSKAARSVAKELKGAPTGGSAVFGPGRAASAIARKPPRAAPASTLFYGAQPVNKDEESDKTAPDNSDTFGRMLNQESGGNQFNKSGQVTTSPKGALGAAQVMPGTGPEAAALAGEEWDPDRLKNDTAYNVKLGRAYFEHLRERFGDDALAAAAYNAGPGAVDHALDKEQSGDGDWMQHLPKETRDYVKNVVLADNTSGRSQHAAGGKVETKTDKVERIVNQLMSLAKSAKKMENKRTEPFLKMKDDVVAKALHIAKQDI